MSEAESEEHSVLLDTARDIERIGDHFENIIELVDYQITNKVKMTKEANNDLADMFELTILTVKEAVSSLEKVDREKAVQVIQKEEQIDAMERILRKKHILRLNENICTGSAAIVFVDIISNLERVGDHAVNIAEAVLGDRYAKTYSQVT